MVHFDFFHSIVGGGDKWFAPPDTNDTSNSVIKCGEKPANVPKCTSPNYCLFNIKDDPCEYNDLSEKFPDILESLKEKLDSYRASQVPRRYNGTMDPLSDPKLRNGVWDPWMDPLPECNSNWNQATKY